MRTMIIVFIETDISSVKDRINCDENHDNPPWIIFFAIGANVNF